MISLYKSKISYFIAGIVVVAVLFVAGTQLLVPKNVEVTATTDIVTFNFGNQIINAEVVATDSLRARGLGGKESLSEDSGMLFIFSKPDFHGIWMKNMLIPIDILWLDADYKIVHAETNILPESYPEVFYPSALADYVLEVNAGTVEKSGILVGQKLEIISTTPNF
jgi:uncharacterized protein